MYLDILEANDCLVNGNAKASATLNDIFSQVLRVKYKLDCSICLVATFELAAASFCKPTNDCLSGNDNLGGFGLEQFTPR